MSGWMRLASCVQVGDPDLWFPTTGGPVEAAKQVCRRCPVIAECEAEWRTLPRHMQLHGIWAGATASERQKRGQVRRARRYRRGGAGCVRCEDIRWLRDAGLSDAAIAGRFGWGRADHVADHLRRHSGGGAA